MLGKLRFHLVLLNTLVLTLILVAISVFLYITMSLNLRSNVESELFLAAEQMSSYVDYFDGVKRGLPIEEEKEESYSELNQKLLNENIATIVWDENFEILRSSVYISIPQQVLKDIVLYNFQENNIDGEVLTYKYDIIDVKIFTTTHVNEYGQMRVVQTIKNRTGEISFLSWLLRILIISVLLGLTLSFIGGYFISGKAIKPAKESLERQQNFVSNVSHELRTPIAVVLTNLEVLKMAGEESVESQKQWLDNAYNEAKRMQKVTSDLLFLANADSGQMELDLEEILLWEVILELKQKFASICRKNNLTIKMDQVNPYVKIRADEARFQQLLIILTDNAIKYSPDGGTISIKTERYKNHFLCEIRDEGIGIPKESLPNIYERFYRADKTRSKAFGGTGLGLSIAKWITDMHGWKLIIESEEQKGTRAIIKIPLEDTINEEDTK